MIKNKNINLIYFNKTFNKSRLKKLIYWSINSFGEKKTVDLIEILKTLGYSYATKAGLSLSIDDLKVPIIKTKLLLNSEHKLNYTNQDVEKGYLTSIEYFAQVIDTWNNTNEILKEEVINNFKMKDVLNPVYMMAFSGARGNISQVRQLVGMRGLMADPSGRIINFPIQSNFREGLTLTEYVISCYGARKGVVDTALRTATSGYLTRRLVDVAQHVIIRVYDCFTSRGIYLNELKTNNDKKLLLLKNRLIGRVLAEDIYTFKSELNLHSFFSSNSIKSYNLKKKKIASKNQEITNKLVESLLKIKKSILVRSPLTCQDKNYVCQLCYGWSLSSNRLVSLGESVGIIAAQSIGEPGTQLTMRTFHTGGVFSGQSSNQIIAKFNGKIEFPQIINGKFVRTTHGKIAFLIKQKSFCLLKSKTKQLKIILPCFTLLFVKQGQNIYKNQVLAEPLSFINELEQSIDIFQIIYSEFSGEIYFKNSKSIEKLNKINKNINLITNVNSKIGQVWILASHKQTILKSLNLFIKKNDFIFFDSFICLYNFRFLKNNIKYNFLNYNIKPSSLVFNKYKMKLKKLEIFNFFTLIKNKNLFNGSFLEFNLFIKFDYFQLIKLVKKKYFNRNKFKKLNDNFIVYSNIKKYYIKNLNTFKLKKSYFLPIFNIKKYSYGLQYKFVINLNSINKLILFENKIKNYSLPIFLFYFCKLNNNKFELLNKIKIIYNNYFFKLPFNFIFTKYLNLIYKNNLKINKFNLNYKNLFKLKNLNFINKNKFNYLTKIKKENYNKKFFISSLNHFSIKVTINNKIQNINYLLYFFFFNNINKKIKSYFYNKSCFNFNEFLLFNNLNNISYLYINELIQILKSFNKTFSYLLFINSELNFFILIIFYKLLNKNIKNYSRLCFKKTNLNKNSNSFNLKNKIDFSIYLNKKLNSWSFYFLVPNLITTINLTNFFEKNYIKNHKNLFLYNFSINSFRFYKLITCFSIKNLYLKKNSSLIKRHILFYNLNKFNIFNINLFKSNLYNLKYFNYLFFSFLFNYLDLNNFINKNNKINNLININQLYFNKSVLLLNIKKKKKLIIKKFILKQKNILYFKMKQLILDKKPLTVNNYFNLILIFLFNIDFFIKLKYLSNLSFLILKKKYEKKFILNQKSIKNKINYLLLNKKTKFNKNQYLYLKKDIIYFYFSSYIFNFVLFNIKIDFSNLKTIYFFNFFKIVIKFFKVKKIKCKKINKINRISKNLKILYIFKHNKTINKNINYNLLFSNIIFYKFIKNLNFILIIFYKFIKKFNNKKFYFIKNTITKNFFSYFEINNIISYNELLILLFYYKNSLFDLSLFNSNNIKKIITIKELSNLNNVVIFDKNSKLKKMLFKITKIKKLYLFLNKKQNFNISIFWFLKLNKFKNRFKVNFKTNLKYYNLNCFKIKNNNKNFKIIKFFNNYNYYFLLPFTMNYWNNKVYKKNFCFTILHYLIKNNKNKNIKIKNKYNINYKLNYYYFLINTKILKKINNIFFKSNISKNLNLLNKFNNLFNKYESLINFINLNSIFQNNWIFYFQILNINTLNIKTQFNFLNKIYFINNNKKNKINFKKYYYYNFNVFIIKKLLNNKNYNILKKYYIINYFQKNILFFTKYNYVYNYSIFYKYNFDFICLSNYFLKNINKNITFIFNNFYINLDKTYDLKKKLLFPIQTLYLFKIQSKINIKENKISIFLFYFLFNFNKNKIKKNYLFNFLKLKFFNFKLKYFFTKYNNLNVKNIFFTNLNYILIGNIYNLNKYNFLYFKNKKIQKKFKIIFNNKYNRYYYNKKINKYYNSWFYITNKINFLFLNLKKVIFKGHFLDKNILFDNKIILNKLVLFRFKNRMLKNIFNFRIYILQSFIYFKIKKNLLNSIFIFYGSIFFNFYLQKSIFNFNNFIFNSYKLIKNKNNNFYCFIKKSYLNKWFDFTNFYFSKIKIKSFIYNKKLNNKKFNIKLINNYYRIIFLQTTTLKKINNFLYFFPISLKVIKNNILNKKNYIKKTLINSNILINNFLNFKIESNHFKRIFLIYNSKIIFNNYNRYKPKLLIYKIIFKYYNLIIKFNKFKNICIIDKSIYLNNLDIISKYFFSSENKILLSQNNLRYYILKFPFKNLIKRKKDNKYFISNEKKQIKNLFKLTYSNFLFLNKSIINLSNSILLFKNNKINIKKYFYNYLLFLNNKIDKMFYNLFYLKGYKYLKNNFFNTKIIINNNFLYLNKMQYKKNFINFIINQKNFIIFFIFHKINYKIVKLYLIKNKENYYFNFNILICPFIYFYKDNTLINTKLKKNLNLTIKVIYKNINTNIFNFTKKFNINFSKFKNLKKIKNKNYISNIYIYFKSFIIEKNIFLIQLNFILNSNYNFNNIILLISINKFSNNIFNKLKLIKIKKISINFNNFKNLINKNKINLKVNTKLSIFKGEVLNTYNLSFIYYYNYLKKSNNIKNIKNIFNLKYYLKEKISLFPEIIYLTNNDFITYKIINNNKVKIKLGEFVSCSTEIILNYSINQSGQIIFLNKNKILLRRAKELLLSSGCIFNLKQGDFINNNSPLLTLTYKNLKTEDIVQGIPKIEQIFEARENLKDKFSLNSLIKLKFKNYKKIYSKKEAVHRSIIFIQQYIVDSVQKVYQSQGVNISDKHIEIIVKQMTSKVKITDPGNTGLLRGDIVYLDWIELINNGLKGKKSQYEPVILGISKACLEMDGFISSASFQETIKILSKAAILQKRDFLRGLKENLILGHLVPVGTGFELINK